MNVEPMTTDQTITVTFSKTRARVAVFMTLFTAGVGNSFLFAILPALGREIGMMEVQIGSIVTVSATVFMICAPVWGHRSEIWGRRPVILFALVAYTVTTILFALVIKYGLAGAIPVLTTYILLLVTRCMFTFGISGLFPSSQAYMADITTPQERTSGMALVGIASGFGMIAGPGLAAAFASYGLIIPFYAAAGLAVIAGITVYFGIVEVPREAPPADTPKEGMLTKRLIPFFIMSTITMISLSAMQQASGFYIQDFFELSTENAAQWVGGALMASALSSVVTQIIIVQRLGVQARTLLRVGPPLIILGIVIFTQAASYPVMIIALITFGMGFGMIMPGVVASLSMSVSGHDQGRAAGVNTSAQGTGFIIGPVMGAGFYQINPLLPYVACVVLLLVAVFLGRHIARQLKNEGAH